MNQETALKVLKLGRNAFITGTAGSGKSYLLGQYINYLSKEIKVSADAIAITASTGIAASLIGGITLHSFSGIGISDYMTDEDIQKFFIKRGKLRQRILLAKILIIDEISMVHRKQFELASRMISYAKGNKAPFGGMQVIVTGDFYQLPPVSKANSQEENRDRFCFMSQTWVDCNFAVCYLNEQHRAKGSELNNLLNAMRTETLDEDHFALLESRQNTQHNEDILHLYTHNEDVDSINLDKLCKIEAKSYIYKATHDGKESAVQTLMKSITAPTTLELKVGAKVMFVKNDMDAGFVNGTQGTIIRFDNNSENDPPFTPVVETVDGDIICAEPYAWQLMEGEKVIAEVKQIPLRLAWAITIHKSQGMSLDEAKINLSRCFETGQGFVALSRLRGIEGLHIEGIGMRALQLNPLAIKADKRFLQLSEDIETELYDIKESDILIQHKSFASFLRKSGTY